MSTRTFTFTDPDGFEIFVYEWLPDGQKPKAVVQVAHGMAEHALRYERFAKYLNEAGFAVYADDHRGHWKTAKDRSKAGIGGIDSWNGMVNDENQLKEIIKKENPDLPLFFFGHSMGSFIAQRFIELWGSELKGAILSGTTGLAFIPKEAGSALEQAAAGELRDKYPEGPGLFESLNAAFEPVKTPFDWLSRDEAEVQKYIDDPWCGFAFSNGMLLDMARGIWEFFDPKNQELIPKDLPILIIAGEKDPVGANDGVKALVQRYKELGIEDVKMILYPGARHEVLNEINRDEVHQDVKDWLEEHLK
ncbi:MAG TPA: alpha/beta hydrolase [Rectinema sp.]|nr:alpha/beta hydrolase [Rectinema sp.]